MHSHYPAYLQGSARSVSLQLCQATVVGTACCICAACVLHGIPDFADAHTRTCQAIRTPAVCSKRFCRYCCHAVRVTTVSVCIAPSRWSASLILFCRQLALPLCHFLPCLSLELFCPHATSALSTLTYHTPRVPLIVCDAAQIGVQNQVRTRLMGT